MIRPRSNKSFRSVLNKETKKKGDVIDHLSAQFSVQYEDGTFGFLFYKDEGVTFTRVNYKENNNVT